jgi:hypothetical protein
MQHYQQYLTNFCQERGDRDKGYLSHVLCPTTSQSFLSTNDTFNII